MKRTLCILLASLLLLSLCACKEAGSGKQLFAFVHSAEEYSDYFTAVADSFCEASKALGYESLVVKPENDTAQAQIALVEDLIKQGVRGIALNANQLEGLEVVLKKAKDAGIPVVTVGRDTKGSQLYIEPSSLELVGISLMDALYDLAGGEGTFAVLSGDTTASGMNPWVSGMKLAAQGSKYQKLTWAETNYSYDPYAGDIEDMKALVTQLLDQYPDLEAICCPSPQTLLACCKAIAELEADIQVTGMCMKPADMQEFVGDGKICPYYLTWDASRVGSCTAYALEALIDGAAMLEGETLVTKQGEYSLQSGYDGHVQITAGPPLRCPLATTTQ